MGLVIFGGRHSVGIDLDQGGVRGLAVEGRGQTWRIRAAFAASGNRDEGLGEARAVLGGGFLAVGLPGGEAVLRISDFPPMKPGELRRAVGYELDRYLPLAAADSVVDFARVPGGSEGQRILLAGARRESIDAVIKRLAAVGWRPAVIEPVVLAQARGLAALGEPLAGVSVLLDLGRFPAHLAVLLDGVPYVSRGVAEQGRELVRAVRHSVEFFRSQTRAGPADRIYLVPGEGALDSPVTDRDLNEEFGSAGFPTPVFPRIPRDTGDDLPGTYLAALGLAVRGVRGVVGRTA